MMVTNERSGPEYITIYHTIPEPFFQIGFGQSEIYYDGQHEYPDFTSKTFGSPPERHGLRVPQSPP